MSEDEFPPGKPTVAHIVRVRLPWNTTDRTECGKDPEQFRRVVSRGEAVRRWKEVGATRARYEFCMTCVDTANRWPSFNDDPVEASKRGATWRTGHDDLTSAELRAVALVLDSHRDEFEAVVGDLLSVAPIRGAGQSHSSGVRGIVR